MKKIEKIIWIAEDDDDDRMMLKEAFEESGYEKPIVFFEDGADILNTLKLIKSKNEKPSLILLDLNMPKVNGLEVLDFIVANKNTKDIPVIIFTTSKSEETRNKVLAKGAIDFITKPYLYDEMVEIVKGLIKSYG